MHYSAEKEFSPRENKEVGVGIIIFSENNDYFYITSGNLVKKEIGKRVEKKVKKVNFMSADELKDYYREQRRMPQEDGSKGAGLGFIDIAIKTHEKIDLELTDADDDLSFLVLTVKFKKGMD